jgi:hypothetical protein
MKLTWPNEEWTPISPYDLYVKFLLEEAWCSIWQRVIIRKGNGNNQAITKKK